MWVVEQKDGKTRSLPAKVLEPRFMKTALSPLAWQILHALSEEPMYPKQVGRKLKMHEQKIYYHIRNLERAGLIKIAKQENIHGVTAKYYGLQEPAFALVLKEMKESQKLFSLSEKHQEFLNPFIVDGKLDAYIVVGSPEPKGPARVRAKDSAYAINLGLFLGTFLNYAPEISVKLDTEIKDLKNNMIIVGGPGVNKVTALVNKKMPINFKESREQKNYYPAIYSSISKKEYAEEQNGIIIKMKNPFDKNKEILLIAGRRADGTKAAIMAFMSKFDEICAGNKRNPKIFAKVVEGVDLDSDGVVDSAEIKE